MDKINLIIDGKSASVEKGRTVFEAARQIGIEIPHLCFYEGLSSYGGCRLCLVEIEGRKDLTASCACPVEEGIIIHTQTERLKKARQFILELLLSDHPLDCLTCESAGNCKLQDYCYEYEVKTSRFAGKKKDLPLMTDNPFIVRDLSKCILCGRCVRVCQEIQFCEVLDFAYRGFDTSISCGFKLGLKETSCVFCGNCVQACPVGALRERQAEGQARAWEAQRTKTICPYCGVGCGIILHTKENKIVKVCGDLDNPVNRGFLCVKGRFGSSDFVSDKERLKQPLIRINPQRLVRVNKDNLNEVFKPISWDEALDFIARKFSEIKIKYGAEAFAGISSARITNEENYLFQKFARLCWGTNNIDHCARLCHAPSVAGLGMSFGSGAMTNSIEEIKGADCIFIIGANPTEAHPVLAIEIRKAKARGAKLIVADPRCTEIAKLADIYLQHRPGSDVVLLNAIMHVIVSLGLEDREFIENRTEGYIKFKELLKEYSPEFAEKISGVDSQKIIQTALMYAKAEKATILYTLGITEHITGTENVMSLANLALVCGKVGRESCGVNPLRGQNNVQGSCDMGALPDVYPGYQKVEETQIREKFGEAWKAEISPKKGFTLLEMYDKASQGELKTMYIVGMDPLLTDACITGVKKALANLEFLVVQDIFFTQTAALADIVLPAACFAEKEGTFTNTERRIQRVRKAVEPPLEAKPDGEIICQIAKRMGYNMGYNPSLIMDEIASLAPIYAGISYARLEKESLQWPCLSKEHPGTKYLHKEKFSRGLGKFNPVRHRPLAEDVDAEFPLLLTTGRNLYHYHITMTAKTEGLNELRGSPYIEINPKDAQRYGIKEKDLVYVHSRRGGITVPAYLTERVQPGLVFIPLHYEEAPVNVLTLNALDSYTQTPAFKVCSVEIKKIE